MEMKPIVLLALLAAALPAHAGKGKSLFDEGDWTAYKGDKTVSIITSVGEVGLLTVCPDDPSGNCSWALVVQPDFCVVGRKIPVLLYGHSGGVSAVLTCTRNDDDGSILLFSDFEVVTALVAESQAIQIAVPVPKKIEVIEFNVKGYTNAVVKLARIMDGGK